MSEKQFLIGNSLVLWYKMDQWNGTTCADSSSSSNNGVVTGTRFTNGIMNGAYDFTNLNNAVRINSFVNAPNRYATLSTWFWFQTNALNAQIASFKKSGYSNGSFSQTCTGSEPTMPRMIFARIVYTDSTYSQTASQGSVTSNAWHNLVYVRSNLNFYMYLDGVLDTNIALLNKDLWTSQGFSVGAEPTMVSAFKSRIDDLRMYNRALSSNEVWNLYCAMQTNVATIVTGHVYVAKTPEQFTYDSDGNLTADGRWNYSWDGENRLASMETIAAAITAGVPRVKCEFTYDYMSRRVSKKVYSAYSGGAYSSTNTTAFLYDGWNLLSEVQSTASSLQTNSYAWGLDLSGSLQGAGGIGGLLSASFGGTCAVTSVFCYDANGNVAELLSTNGSILAHYEYDPIGNIAAATGPMAYANPFRFSTKYWDDETGLGYWGYRYCSPRLARWVSRDLVGESGGENLYAMLQNQPIGRLDALGLINISIPATVTLTPSIPVTAWVKKHGRTYYGETIRNLTTPIDYRVLPSCGCLFTLHDWELEFSQAFRADVALSPWLQAWVQAHEDQHVRIATAVTKKFGPVLSSSKACGYTAGINDGFCKKKRDELIAHLQAQITHDWDSYDKLDSTRGYSTPYLNWYHVFPGKTWVTVSDLVAFGDKAVARINNDYKPTNWNCP